MKLSKTLLQAIQTYYFNRQRQNQFQIKWDKDADLNTIFKIGKKEKYSIEACCGTFWFSKSTKTKWHIIKINEDTYPNGESYSTPKDK